MKQIELINFLKGFSIFTIVIYHVLDILNGTELFHNMIRFGGTGIHLFFFLSGLGLYLSHTLKPLGLQAFLRKRFSKIYFPYASIVILSAAISLFVPIYTNSIYALGGHLLLYKMFDESIIGSYGYPLWFISTIIQFYLSFHIIVYLKKKTKDLHFLIITISISLLWSFFVVAIGKESERIWNSFFLQYLWEFGLGILAAKRIIKGEQEKIVKLKSWQTLSLGIGFSISYALLALKGGEIGQMYNDIPAFFGFTFIAIWLYNLKLKAIRKFFLFTGSISFSIYLVHTLVLRVIFVIFENSVPSYIIVTCTIVFSYLGAMYFQRFTGIVTKSNFMKKIFRPITSNTAKNRYFH